jgi:VanZ family protein
MKRPPTLFWAALAYTAFVVYGSLVPLDFRPLPWEEAVARLRAIPWLNLGVGARADWVANVLLFIPLSFLWLGLVWHGASNARRLLASLVVFAAAVLLSAAIEFTQLFFPPRTVSLNDLAAESLGALLGILAWWRLGPPLLLWLQAWRNVHGPLEKSERWLAVWLAGLFLYNLLPLDLTLSPVELYHKYKEGRVLLRPFAGLPHEPVAAAWELATDVALWIPAAWLWRAAGASRARAVASTVAAATLLEFLQLWVWSRVSDVTDILTATLGALLGAGLARPGRPGLPPLARGPALTLALLWLGLVVAVFWYPFDFRLDAPRLAREAAGLLRVPFALYYFGTEFRAVTEVLHKVMFFLPLGFLLGTAWGRRAALVLGALGAAAVEGGQLFLPGKHADFTDWLLETGGVALGAALAPAAGGQVHRRAPSVRRRPGFVLGLWLAFTLGGLFASRLSPLPYNVRELFASDHPLLSSALLSLLLLWGAGLPVVVARLARTSPHPFRLFLFALPLHGLVGYFLLRLAVPLESLDDILGSPSLGWPWEWERLGRFLGLAAASAAAVFGAALMVFGAPRPLRWLWGALLFPLLLLAYAVVVLAANTDNLTELLAHGGRLDAFLWVWLAGFFTSLAGYGVARWAGTGRPRWVPVAILGAAGLTWGALTLGLESVVVKYGQVFSALQFLLSRDRSHYAAGGELVLRFTLAWTLAVALLALVAGSVARVVGDGRVHAQVERGKPRPGHGGEGRETRDVEMAR